VASSLRNRDPNVLLAANRDKSRSWPRGVDVTGNPRAGVGVERDCVCLLRSLGRGRFVVVFVVSSDPDIVVWFDRVYSSNEAMSPVALGNFLHFGVVGLTVWKAIASGASSGQKHRRGGNRLFGLCGRVSSPSSGICNFLWLTMVPFGRTVAGTLWGACS
jgi:hypothetical protein